MGTPLLQLAGDRLRFGLDSDAHATLTDLLTGKQIEFGRVGLQEDGLVDVGHVWPRSERSICEQFPSRFRGIKVSEDTVEWIVLGREGAEVGTFQAQYELEGEWLVVRLTDLDEALPTLTFPTPIVSESLLLPIGVGRWVRKPLSSRHFWTPYGHLNMRWFGGLIGDDGWLAVFDEGWHDAGVSGTALSLMPGWLKTLDRWQGVKTIRYRLTNGGYVGLAKAFRKVAFERGLAKTLAEKIAETPSVGNMLGGRTLSFMQAHTLHPSRYEDRFLTMRPEADGKEGELEVMISHRRVAELIEEAQRLGVRNAVACVRGWIQGGYDETHPDIWPPDARLGSVEELRTICRQEGAITVALHDNYQDIYPRVPSWPEGVIRTRAGEPMPGGFWAGGQTYILNPRDGLRLAQRNWHDIRNLEPRGMFPDTTTAVRLYESFEQGNETTRKQDEDYKIDLLKFYKSKGLALGSEESSDFGLQWVDWLENRHRRVPGESVPLWPLVFHDCVFNGRYIPSALDQEHPTSSAPYLLTDMLWGYHLIWSDWQAGWQERLKETLRVDEWHGQIGAAEMTQHAYLSEDGMVERCEFGDLAITVNFSDEPREVEGKAIEAGGVRIV